MPEPSREVYEAVVILAGHGKYNMHAHNFTIVEVVCDG
jgi:hypothetical protein